MMNANMILFDDSTVRLSSVALPEPSANEVTIRLVYSLISNGTEKASLSGEENTANVPRRFGYSGVGYVTAVGAKVRTLKKGDRVYASYMGHTDYAVKAASEVFRLPDSVSFEDGVFLKLASFPLLALRRARYEMGESVVIVGTGMLGLFGVQIARLAGAVPLIAVGGSRQDRLDRARVYGADHVLTASDPDLAQKILTITQEHTMYKGANVIIETSGSESALHSALEYTAKNARVVLNGCNRVTKEPIDLYMQIHRRGVSLIGANNSNRPPQNSMPGNWTTKRDYKVLLEWMASGRLDAKSMISEYADPHDAPAVYDRLLHDRDFPLGVLFDWEHFSA